MSLEKRCHLLFFTLIGFLTLYKWNDLSLPYFWDELGVYTRAAHYQYSHTVSLLPASVPPELSRGHPLFFIFMIGGFMRVMGEQVPSLHLFCFVISLLLLSAVYIKVSKYFSPLAALISVFILSVQPLFVAQSALVLPEIFLSLLLFLAICSYYEDKLLLFAIYGSIAILTKESAIILPVSVLTYSLWRYKATGVRPSGLYLSGILLTMIPYLVFITFLVIQKQQNGWYLFPYHFGLVSFQIKAVAHQILRYIFIVFFKQGRTLVSVIVFFIFIYQYIAGKIYSLNGYWYSILIIAFSVLFIGFNSLFSVYMDRYVLMVVVTFSIVCGVLFASLSERYIVLGSLLMVTLLTSSYYMDTKVFGYDTDQGYRRQIHVLQQSIKYVSESPNQYKVNGNFPAYYAIGCPDAGYLSGNRPINPYLSDADSVYYFLKCEPGDTDIYSGMILQKTLVKKFDDEYAHVYIYRVTRK
jgi:hypothetical protein